MGERSVPRGGERQSVFTIVGPPSDTNCALKRSALIALSILSSMEGSLCCGNDRTEGGRFSIFEGKTTAIELTP